MNGTLTAPDGTSAPATPEALRAASGFFWLDLDGLDDEASDVLLHDFGFHPLAVEDAEHFGQRPKIDEYDGFTYFVLHGAQTEKPAETVEVHVF